MCYESRLMFLNSDRDKIKKRGERSETVLIMGLNKFVSFFGNNADSNNRITSTYSSELDIYGNSQRLKKSLLWSSLRKPKKGKGIIEMCMGIKWIIGKLTMH